MRPTAVLATTKMETLYRVPFLVLECPNLKLKKPPWVHMPSAMTVYALVVVSYFLITGGNSGWRGSRGTEPWGTRPGGSSSSDSQPPGKHRSTLDRFGERREILGCQVLTSQRFICPDAQSVSRQHSCSPIAFLLLAS